MEVKYPAVLCSGVVTEDWAVKSVPGNREVAFGARAGGGVGLRAGETESRGEEQQRFGPKRAGESDGKGCGMEKNALY